MKVILLQHIRGIGRVGDIKDVNDGYARNFLFPRQAAKPATDGIVKEVTAAKAKKLELADMHRQELQALAKELTGTRVELSRKANQKGTLFAAIPDITVNGRVFALPEPIKNTGEHPVSLKLGDGVSADVTVVVTPR